MLVRTYLISFVFFLLCKGLNAQNDSSSSQKPAVQLSGFVDAFYVYDFNKPQTNFRQPFLYNHNRHNEFNLNLGVLKVGIEHSKYRAHFALHAGTYSNDNYTNEPGVLKNIFEANAGIALNKKNNLWLDAGIFASHVGFESAISIDNWTLTRSLVAESSPYFLSGAKLSYEPNQKWELTALIINGWQRIQRLQGNSLPSFGTQISFKPKDKITLNWSTFIGTDDPDSTRRMRYFNNFYGQFQIFDKLGLIAGLDFGIQQSTKGSPSYENWFGPVLILRYSLSEKWAMALRGEYYQDETGIIVETFTPNGFQTSGLSLNLDYLPFSTTALRLEGRWLNSADDIFPSGNSINNSNFIIAGSLAVKF